MDERDPLRQGVGYGVDQLRLLVDPLHRLEEDPGRAIRGDQAPVLDREKARGRERIDGAGPVDPERVPRQHADHRRQVAVPGRVDLSRLDAVRHPLDRPHPLRGRRLRRPVEPLEDGLDPAPASVEGRGDHPERRAPPPVRRAYRQTLRHLGHRSRLRGGDPAVVAQHQPVPVERSTPRGRPVAQQRQHGLAGFANLAVRRENVDQRAPRRLPLVLRQPEPRSRPGKDPPRSRGAAGCTRPRTGFVDDPGIRRTAR